MKFESNFKLGSVVEDVITGFKGKVIAHCIFLNGCVQHEVMPEMTDKQTEYPKAKWIDDEQLRLVKPTEIESSGEKPPGGPHNTPTERSMP